MSTILDALRRVQRERPHDLGESVTLDDPETSPDPRRWLWLLLPVLLLAGSASAAWFVWPGSETIQREWAAYTAPDAEAPAEPVSEAVVAKLEPEPVRPSRPARPTSTLAERRARAAAAAKRRAERVARGRVAKPPPEPAPSAQAAEPKLTRAPAAIVASAVESDPPPFVNAPSAAERPRFEVGIELEPAPRPSEDEERVAEKILGESADPGRFPDLSVETVRWHPQPDRREARVLLDNTRPIDAREGDIVAGVKVHRIDPGAVEFRLGDLRKRLPIGP